MPVPPEFRREFVAAASPPEKQMYRDVNGSAEPLPSIERAGLTFSPDESTETHLSDHDRHYYNTTGEALELWRGQDLPAPSKDLQRLRADLEQWGYCLVQDALSQEQLATLRERLDAQAAGERAAGVALWLNASARGSTTQFVTTLVNKGRCFEGLLDFDPAAVQAGPVIEQLLSEALGGEFLFNSFFSIIAHKHGYPQGLHQDANGSAPLQTEVPLMITAMYMLDDVSAANGGTLIVPGSHRQLLRAGSGRPVPGLKRPISVTAPAGSALLFDGRVLHGTGVNRTDAPRRVVLAAGLRTFMRTQELWHLALRPEVLARAGPRLRQRLGFVAHTIGTVEGHGLGASGAVDDEFSSILEFREASDRGEYLRIGELSPSSSAEELGAPFTYRRTASGRRSVAKAAKFGLLSGDALAAAQALSGGQGYTARGTGNNEITPSNAASSKL